MQIVNFQTKNEVWTRVLHAYLRPLMWFDFDPNYFVYVWEYPRNLNLSISYMLETTNVVWPHVPRVYTRS
jgi:hypothetical protein